MPEGYAPISSLTRIGSVHVELPPPHFAKSLLTVESEESDIADLASAMENMSVHSPVFAEEDYGNVEPNLRPVDRGLSAQPKVFPGYTPYKTNNLRQQQPRDSSLFVTKLNPFEQRYLPSLYFEVAVELLQKEYELSPSERYH